MATNAKTNFRLSSCNFSKRTEHERRDRTKSAAGVLLLLIEVAGPILALALALLSVLASLGG